MRDMKLKLTINADGNVSGVVRGINNDLNKFKSQTKHAADQTDRLGASLKRAGHYGAALFGGYQLTQAISNITASADAYSSLQGQLKLVTDSASELVFVQGELNRISFETRGDIQSMTNLYSALSPTFEAMGKTTEESIRLVSLYNKSLALTSPNATEASAATLQFAQAMGSGVLRGEEFNSIMENGRGVAMMLADGLGVPIGSLRAMAEQGQLTADIVVAALERQESTINEKFTNIPLTVSQAWQNMRTQAMLYVGEQDQALGTSKAFAKSLNIVAANIDTVAAVTGGALVLATTVATGKIAGLAAAKVSDMKATASANAATLERLAGLKAVAQAEHRAAIAVLQKAQAQKAATAGTVLATSADKAHAAALMATRASVTNLKRATIEYNAVANKSSLLVTGLRGAMSMLGGPVGIGLAIASFASYSFASDEAAVNTQEMIDRVSTLTGKFDELSRSQTQQALKQINADIEMMRAKVFTSKDKSLWDTLFGNPDEARKKSAEEFKAYQALVQAKKDLEAQLADASTQTKDTRKVNLSESKDDEKAWNEAVKAFHGEYRKELEADAKAQEALNKINKSYTGDIEKLRFGMAKLKLSNADVAAAEAMRAAANKGYSRDQINSIGSETKALFALQEANKAALKEEKAVAKERNIVYENLFNRLDDGFAQMWVDVMDGSKTAFDFIQESFKRAIAEMAHTAITKPIILSIMGDSVGLASLAGSSADLFGVASSLNRTSQSAMLAAQTAEFGSEGAALTAQAAGGATGGFGAMASAAMPWLAGGLLVESLTGGGISKGLFGGGWKRKNAEITLSGGMSGVNAYQSITKQKAGGLFSSRKKKTSTEDISASLGETVRGLLQEIDTIANQIGFDLADSFSTEVKVSAGKKGSIQAAMAEAVGTVTNKAIDSVAGLRAHLTKFQRVGESLTDTMKRLAEETKTEAAAAKAAAEEKARIAKAERKAQLQSVTDAEKLLVGQFIAFETQSSSLKSTLLELADPQQALAYQREQELKTIDPLLQSQQKRLWALQDEAAAVEKAKQAHSSYQNTLSGVLGSLGSAFTNIKQFTAALVLGASASGATYASTLSLAQSGDQNALSSITQSAQAYLDDALAKSATSIDYERVKAGVIGDLNSLPDQVSVQQFITDEIKAAIQSQTETLSFDYAASLKTNFDALIPVVGQSITKDEFSSVYAGTATDAELQKVFSAIAGADGLITATDLTTAAASNTADKTQTVADRAASQLSELESITLATNSQVTAMGVLTDALGYNAQIQEKGLLQTAVDVAQKRFDNIGITGKQVSDWEAKKAAAEATDATSLQKKADAAYAKHQQEAAILSGWYNEGSMTGEMYLKSMADSYKQNQVGVLTDQASAARAADKAWEKVSGLSQQVSDYYAKAAELKAAQDALAAFDGSHADGLSSVPFDGYRAELHKDEAVIDARTMSGLRKYGININNSSSNDEIIAELRQLNQILTNLERITEATNYINRAIALHSYESKSVVKKTDMIGMPLSDTTMDALAEKIAIAMGVTP